MDHSYVHLTGEERYLISALWKTGLSLSEITNTIGKSKSTISREIRINTGKRVYRPKNVTWTCMTQSGAAMCPSAAGSGNIESVLDLPVNSSLIYSFTGQVIDEALIVSPTITPPNGYEDIITQSNSDVEALLERIFKSGFENN